ncbi:ABC transporter ATP-binding protein [Halorubrum sp. BOL3-1]|uniref:ABC transporter ATP-binding protein n=1 Tax=Halorubrum sp. BOL3-1 TaxID=2497325 RepID=UPI001005048A|nr:ABC transporter ATP-binding protein [Halorubrum sp. BOL3-1]QAU13008.1 ABC transporter ATP-binding protein [Halorubrum sp. BOL3-1]
MARSAASERGGPRERDETRREGDDVSTDETPGPPALSVEGLTKRFGEGSDAVTAVDDVSLAVERGSVVGLLGPNGAGKTTLIKCALGIVIPDAGSVRVFGADVRDGRRVAYADVDAMLEGARNDYWRLTVRENLRYFATVSGVDPDSVAARHDRLLDRLDLADKADTPVRDLSRGMKQKVSLASVLAGGAELVFLDEPTLGLDVESARTLRAELRRLAAEEGLTIVVSSHDMTTIEAVCDRVVMLSNGRIAADDTVEALLGGADRDAVRVASPDLDAETVDGLRERFEVVGVDAEANPPAVTVVAGGDRLYDLTDALRAAGVTVSDIRTVQPDLEDVFLERTGRVPEAGGDPR